MLFPDLVKASQQYFPNLQIKFKNESLFMKILGLLLFFNTSFMKSYTTTIGNTIYYPTQNFVKSRPVSASVILLHELVHMYDQKRFSRILFSLSYLFPQIMFPICLILLFFISWKIMIPLAILSLLPIPAAFRTYWEKRGYISSLYVLKMLGSKLNFNSEIESHKNSFLNSFHGSSYYFMWPFGNIDKDFNKAMDNLSQGKRPFEDKVYDMLEDLVSKV